MTMRKKDYEAIARAINNGPSQEDAERNEWETVQAIASAIADYCATQDPTFKRDRFLADCGVSHD
jgi:hypothetical protein